MSRRFLVFSNFLTAALVIWGSAVLLFPLPLPAATTLPVTLQWAANTEPDLAGYRVYQGITTGTYGSVTDVGNVTTYTPAHLQTDQTYYFTVTAYDLHGNESLPSTEVNTSGSTSFDGTGSASSLTISNLTVASGKPYVIASGLQIGSLVYIDRTYTFTTVPASLQGALYIQPANDDKTATTTNFLSFEVNEPVTVYVAYDSRISPKPAWLTTFTDTGEDLTLSNHSQPFDLLAQTFAAGPITLGGNTGGYSMYSVVVKPAELFQEDGGAQLLTVMRAGTGTGTITSSPSGLHCGSTCSAEFSSGTVVQLAAEPSADSTFDGWSGDVDCDDGQVTMSGLVSCTATFTGMEDGGSSVPSVSLLSVSISGNGKITSSPYGIECTNGTCSTSFATGTRVTLTAHGERPDKFAGWSGACRGKSECILQLSTDQFVGASFTRNGHLK
jgi:hypothetical protein